MAYILNEEEDVGYYHSDLDYGGIKIYEYIKGNEFPGIGNLSDGCRDFMTGIWNMERKRRKVS